MKTIVTDGACRGNPGPGGWSALIIDGPHVEELGGADPHTTNNRMELRAAIEGLQRVPPPEPVRLITDSAYVAQGAQQWVHGWRRRNWVTLEGKPVENRDLWEQLDALTAGRVTWELVRGHTGHPANERANAIAQRYAGSTGGKSRPARTGAGSFYLSLIGTALERHATWAECSARVHGVSGARFKKVSSLEEAATVVRGWGLQPNVLDALS